MILLLRPAARGLSSKKSLLVSALGHLQLNDSQRVSQNWAAAAQYSSSTPGLPVQRPPRLDFDDYAAIFKSRTTGELLRMLLVLKLCSVNALVSNADVLVRTSRTVLGDKFTFSVLCRPMFKQFCAGETDTEIWPTINTLRDNGIGAIIDYAAEDDVAADTKPRPATAPSSTAAATDGAGSSVGSAAGSAVETLAVGRTYNYADEETCDKHVGIFLKAIDTVARIPGQGFAAIKVTALGSTQLLQRMSRALVEIRSLFKEADTDGDGFVDRAEFEVLYRQLFPNAKSEQIDARFKALDLEGAGKVDIISWSHRIHYQLCSVALTQEEVSLANALLERVASLAAAAAERQVKLMIDAEHTYFQPAIDHTAHVLSLRYNRTYPVIFNTYQAYLKASFQRLQEDMERARREKYIFAAKLVRGAYVKLERARAARLGYESPIWDTIDQTHTNFNTCLEAVLNEVVAHHAQLMVASHNQESIELTVQGMAQRNLAPKGSGVYFGQLLGMSDNLTFTLGQHGYEAFKYVPYGSIQLVLPYLIRRAHENSAIMGAGVGKQIAMLEQELWRRLTHPLSQFMRPAAAVKV